MTTAASLTPEQRRREEQLVEENLPLVGYLVSELIGKLPSHVSREDLRGAGLAGLAHAARGWDPERGVPFASFARQRIRGALLDELRSNDWASRSVRHKARAKASAEEELAGRLGRTPTAAEVAAHAGLNLGDLQSVDGDIHRAVVLSIHGFEDPSAVDDLMSVQVPTVDDQLLAREQAAYLHDAVAVLPDRLRTVVTGYFFEDRPMAEIGAELGVSESRVSQMRAEALAMLKDGLNSQLAPEMVEPVDRPGGCVDRRREAYFAAVASQSTYRSRLAAVPDRRELRTTIAIGA